MPSRGWTTVVAAAAYLAGTTIVTYAVLAGATWDDHPWLLPTLVLVHFAAGLAIGRWWALALPFAWALLSAGAEGYDTRASVVIAFFIPFTWLPATAAGVAVRRIVAWRRSGTGRLWPSILVLGTALALVLSPYLIATSQRGSDVPEARFDLLDEERGRYGGAAVGDLPNRVFAGHGRTRLLGDTDRYVPTSLGEDDYPTAPNVFSSRWWVCYPDVCFWFNRDPRPGAISQARPEVQGLYLTSPGAETLRGIEVGDGLRDVEDAYPELECHSRGDFGWLGDERYCTGKLGALQVWFGGDPVDVIVVARGGMSDS